MRFADAGTFMASIQFRIVVRGVNWPLLVELQAELFNLALNSGNLEIRDLVWAHGKHPTIDSSYMPAKDGNHQAQTHGGKHGHRAAPARRTPRQQ